MTMEERVKALEEELARLRDKPGGHYSKRIYTQASQKCEERFNQVRQAGQDYGALIGCETITREAVREKYRVRGKGQYPGRYIDTMEKGIEYVALFQEFLTVYQRFLSKKEG